jgi:hypothetical protein
MARRADRAIVRFSLRPEQIPDHQVGIALYQVEAQPSPDPQLRGFAQKYLPVPQHHLQTLLSLSSVAALR